MSDFLIPLLYTLELVNILDVCVMLRTGGSDIQINISSPVGNITSLKER